LRIARDKKYDSGSGRMIGIKDRGRLPERQVTAAKTHRLQDYERQRERERGGAFCGVRWEALRSSRIGEETRWIPAHLRVRLIAA